VSPPVLRFKMTSPHVIFSRTFESGDRKFRLYLIISIDPFHDPGTDGGTGVALIGVYDN